MEIPLRLKFFRPGDRTPTPHEGLALRCKSPRARPPPGGGRWLSIDELVREGALLPRELLTLVEGHRMLTGIRVDLHLAAGRSQDVLSRDEQLRLAESRGVVGVCVLVVSTELVSRESADTYAIRNCRNCTESNSFLSSIHHIP